MAPDPTSFHTGSLTSQHWSSDKEAEKPARKLDFPFTLPCLGAFPAVMSSQALALWTVATGFSEHSSLAQVSSSQRRPTFVVLSFARTFVLSLVSSCTITASAVASQAALTINSVLPSILAPVLHQPFVAGPGFSPIPAKLIHLVVAGKFIELNDLLSLNLTNLSCNCGLTAAW